MRQLGYNMAPAGRDASWWRRYDAADSITPFGAALLKKHVFNAGNDSEVCPTQLAPWRWSSATSAAAGATPRAQQARCA
jgi:hypothetical protein